MTLFDRIRALYPGLTDDECWGENATFSLQNDGDERGDYIRDWKNMRFPYPSSDDLAGIVPKEPS